MTLTLTTPDGKTSVKANFSVAGLREALSEEATMSGDYQLTLQNASPGNQLPGDCRGISPGQKLENPFLNFYN